MGLLAMLGLAACDTVATTPSQPETAETRLSECLDLGFAPSSVEMQSCLQADTRAERRLIADRETYGTV